MSDTSPITVSPADEMRARLDGMSQQQLDLRRREIVESAKGNYEDLPIEALQELSFIVATLRRKSSGPPKAARTTTGSSPKVKPTIDNLI